MLLTLITKPEEIQSCQTKLIQLITKQGNLDQEETHNLEFNIKNMTTYYNYNYSIWFAHAHVNETYKNVYKSIQHNIKRKRKIYWNGFGLTTNLQGDKDVQITVETNILCSGHQGNYAGFFAKDKNNNIYILHTGKLNKNTNTFKTWYQDKFPDKWVKLIDRKEPAILITTLKEASFLENIISFVSQVASFKSSVKP